MGITDELLADAKDRMAKSVESSRGELATVRTGRANTALVEHLHVTHYGQSMPLNQLATLAAPEPQLITIQPWDRGTMDSIMKAIQTSDLGINPSNDGRLIRLPIPPLTEARRRELVKQVHGRAEEARVAVRNVRRDGMDLLKRLEKDGKIGEDEHHKNSAKVQELTDKLIKEIDQMLASKEAEIKQV